MVQKLVNLLYIKKIKKGQLLLCQGDSQTHSHICILAQSSYAEVCIDLCKHYCFRHKMTTLVTPVSKIYCSISSFLRNFSNSRWKKINFSCEVTHAQAYGHRWTDCIPCRRSGEEPSERWGQEEYAGGRLTASRTGPLARLGWTWRVNTRQHFPTEKQASQRGADVWAPPPRFSSERGNHSARGCCSHAHHTNKP